VPTFRNHRDFGGFLGEGIENNYLNQLDAEVF
jgi:hypothetical protein